jgi:dTDP-glucose 4,6-dehydratase
MKLLVTGGCGFIGSNFIRYWLKNNPSDRIVNLDKLTYAAHLSSTHDFASKANYKFVKGDICDSALVNELMKDIDVVVHFAAESHVDRSISDPSAFIRTNVFGTFTLLNAALKSNIKLFCHVSTDEVFGAFPLDSKLKFNENTPYNPRSPYSASKAASDNIARSYFTTYGLPVIVTNSSNNFGPYQDPEKFLPRAITNLIQNKPIMLYGDGNYVRDWIYVLDHVRALEMVIKKGKAGERYLIGGMTKDITNLEIAKRLIKIFNKDESYIQFIKDRPGHDRKYSVDWSKIRKELGFKPKYDFDEWLEKTVEWYRKNEWWWLPIKDVAESFYQGQPLLDGRNVAGKISEHIYATKIKGLYKIEMPVFNDNRGFFHEVFRLDELKQATGIDFKPCQWNHSLSKPRVIRAIHTEYWNKLVYPVTGKMYAAIVDARPDSDTFGTYEEFIFDNTKDNSPRFALFISKGLGNSICALGDTDVNYMYLVDEYWDSSKAKGIAWDDPDLNIRWPIENPIISDRDRNNPRMRDLFPEKYGKKQ